MSVFCPPHHNRFVSDRTGACAFQDNRRGTREAHGEQNELALRFPCSCAQAVSYAEGKFLKNGYGMWDKAVREAKYSFNHELLVVTTYVIQWQMTE